MYDRRRFLVLTGGALASVIASLSADAPEPFGSGPRNGRIDPAVLRWLEEQVPRLRRMDDRVAGEGLRQVVLGQLRIAVDLLRTASSADGDVPRLLTVLAHLAQLGGWLSFDEGWHASAQSLFTTGLKAARSAGAPGLAANTLAAMSFQSTLTGRPADGIRLAVAADEHAARQPRLVRAMTATRLARAHARHGDASACGRALNQAENHLDAARDRNDAPEWIYYFDHAEFQAQAGTCWVDLGQPRRALPALRTATAELGADYIRDGAVYRVRAAQAHLRTGDLERTCAVLAEAAHLAHQARATRPLADLRTLCGRLDPRDPRVRDLTDRVHAIIG